jgi:hypothetical protein
LLTCPRGSLIHNESLRVWISYSSSSVWASALSLFASQTTVWQRSCPEPSSCSSARRAWAGVLFPRDECSLSLARQGIAKQCPERGVLVVSPKRQFSAGVI